MYYFGKVIDMYKICVSSCFKIVEITMSITYIYTIVFIFAFIPK